MINLLSPEAKRDIRAARVNVILVQYCVMLVVLVVLVAIVYGAGFWLVAQNKSATQAKLQDQAQEAKQYEVYQKRAEDFRKNLKTAKTILDGSYSYGDFLLNLAKVMPAQTIVTTLELGDDDKKPGAPGSVLSISARAFSYEKILELKSSLEASDLFENVNIISYSRPDDLSTLTEYEKPYPYEVSVSVQLSATAKPKVTTP